MPLAGRAAPAVFRRAFCFCAALLPPALASGAVPPRALPELAQIGKPDPAEAARLVEQFRTAGIPGDYYLEFELRALPRRGEGPTLRGRWWGSRNAQGALSRIEITDATGAPHRFILQNGDGAKMWRQAAAAATAVEGTALLQPLVAGIELTAFDLLMPFLYWPAPTVERITRKLGRPAHEFLFRAPPALTAAPGGIGAVRAYLDTQFNAPVEIDTLGADGRATRNFTLLSLKTIQRQTLPKAMDYRNELTRDKTRLQLTGAALDLRHPPACFDPATLGEAAAPPSAAQVTRIDP
jgi:hypothetical protein